MSEPATKPALPDDFTILALETSCDETATSHHSMSHKALAGEMSSPRSSRLCGLTQSSRLSCHGLELVR